MSNHATPITLAPPRPPSSTARKTHAVLAWLGWTVGYAIACAGLFLVFSRSTTNWWFIPVLIGWAAAAYLIGRVYRQSEWVFGPVAAGVVPPLILLVAGVIESATRGRTAGGEDGAGYVAFAGMIGIVVFGAASLVMAFLAWLGVWVGQRRAEGEGNQRHAPPGAGSSGSHDAAVGEVLSTAIPRDPGSAPGRDAPRGG